MKCIGFERSKPRTRLRSRSTSGGWIRRTVPGSKQGDGQMKTKFLIAGLVLATSAGAFAAAPANKDVDVVAELQALKAEVARLRAESGDTWLNQRRAEEVKALVHEVLADADTRASLAGEGMTAGYNKHFFLASEDGKFLMQVFGQLQFRYIASFNQKDGVSGHSDDDEDEGFQFRRAKVGFEGHVEAGRQWDYEVVLATDYSDSLIFAEDLTIGTQIADGLYLKAGKFKLPFLREELTSSRRQLAVDRGVVSEYFTLNRAEQVQLKYDPMDAVKLMVSLSDGANSETSTIGADSSEFAITARADVKLAGEWGQMKDYNAWEGEPFAAFVGGALHYELGDGKNGQAFDAFSWTVDGSVETNGLGVSVAGMGAHIEPDSGDSADIYGLVVQGAYQVIPNKLEPFVKFELIDSNDTGSDDTAYFLTFGGNYYFDKHDAKFTLDMIWWIDGSLPPANPIGASATSSGLGFASGDPHSEDALVLRAQFQLLF
ncbi:MAG: hypothetical protein GC159_19180 [Phycisphaera sp.]|nr:hypothetical protein [Phycisphaera sp.]